MRTDTLEETIAMREVGIGIEETEEIEEIEETGVC